MSPVRSTNGDRPSVGRISAEVRRAAGFALLVAAVVELPLALMSARGANAAEPGSLLDTIVAASQLPGLLLTHKDAPAPAADPFIDPGTIAAGARSMLPPGVTLATAINTLIMAVVAYLAFRTLHAIWPRRTPSRPARAPLR